jgi:hypothetical protein
MKQVPDKKERGGQPRLFYFCVANTDLLTDLLDVFFQHIRSDVGPPVCDYQRRAWPD